MRTFILLAFLCSASFGAPLTFKTEIVTKDKPVLIVTLSNGRKIEAKKAIFQAEASKLSIKNNVLIIYYEGGARSKWTDVLKLRPDSSSKDMVLIGRTYEIEDTGGEYPKERLDANYVIGKVDRVVGKKKRSCSFKSKQILLSTFDFPNQKDDYLEELEKACLVKN